MQRCRQFSSGEYPFRHFGGKYVQRLKSWLHTGRLGPQIGFKSDLIRTARAIGSCDFVHRSRIDLAHGNDGCPAVRSRTSVRFLGFSLYAVRFNTTILFSSPIVHSSSIKGQSSKSLSFTVITLYVVYCTTFAHYFCLSISPYTRLLLLENTNNV